MFETPVGQDEVKYMEEGAETVYTFLRSVCTGGRRGNETVGNHGNTFLYSFSCSNSSNESSLLG